MSKILRNIGLAVAASVVMTTPIAAQTMVQLQIGNPEIMVDGVVMHIAEPVIIDGRAVVPLRPVIEALGGSVIWNENLRFITIRDHVGENEIILQINSHDSVVNGRTGPRLDVPPMLAGETAKVPISFVSAHLGFAIEWNEQQQTITITGK